MKQITPLAIVRLVIYVLAALAGLAATIMSFLGYADYAPILAAVSGAAATIAGGTAAYNINQTPGQKIDLMALIAQITAIADEAKAIQARKTTTTSAPVEYVGQHRTDTPVYSTGTSTPEV